jgi:hypothetical protein
MLIFTSITGVCIVYIDSVDQYLIQLLLILALQYDPFQRVSVM